MRRRSFISAVGSGAGLVSLNSSVIGSLSDFLLENGYELYSTFSTPPPAPEWVPSNAINVSMESVSSKGVSFKVSSQDVVKRKFVGVLRKYPNGSVRESAQGPIVPVDETPTTVSVSFENSIPQEGTWVVVLHSVGTDGSLSYVGESGPIVNRNGSVVHVDTKLDVSSVESFRRFQRTTKYDSYVLEYQFGQSRLTFEVSRAAHAFAKTRQRNVISLYDTSLSNPYGEYIARRFRDEYPEHSESELLEKVLSFIWSFAYRTDIQSVDMYEYPRTVEETLVNGFGDCEDTTYLLSSVLENGFGYDTCFVVSDAHAFPAVKLDDIPFSESKLTGTIEFDGMKFVPIETVSKEPIGKFQSQPINAIYYQGDWYSANLVTVFNGFDDALDAITGGSN